MKGEKMMHNADYDYWKKKYENYWSLSSDREKRIKLYIEQETGMELEATGLGAESTAFISGNAQVNNNEKGAPDFHVKGTNIYIEVTGSFSKKTKADDNIWIRPDKLNYASRSINEKDEFFVVEFLGANIIHVIHFDENTKQYALNSRRNGTDYNRIQVPIRGGMEQFVSIKSNTEYVRDLSYLIDYIKATQSK